MRLEVPEEVEDAEDVAVWDAEAVELRDDEGDADTLPVALTLALTLALLVLEGTKGVASAVSLADTEELVLWLDEGEDVTVCVMLALALPERLGVVVMLGDVVEEAEGDTEELIVVDGENDPLVVADAETVTVAVTLKLPLALTLAVAVLDGTNGVANAEPLADPDTLEL